MGSDSLTMALPAKPGPATHLIHATARQRHPDRRTTDQYFDLAFDQHFDLAEIKLQALKLSQKEN